MKLLTALPFAFSIFLSPAFADDIQTLAPVRSVTMYPGGATLTRVITADVPAGSHRILFPVPAEALEAGPPRIRSSFGFELGAQELLRGYITDPEQVYSPSQALAFERLEALRDELEAANDAVNNGNAAVSAAKAQVTFLRSISGGSLENVDAASLTETVVVIGEQVAQALTVLQNAEISLRSDQEALNKIRKRVAQAEQDFSRTSPPQGAVDMMAVSVDVGAAQTVEFTLDYLTYSAGWGVDYEMFLDRDTASIDVSRKVAIRQYTDEVWSDVELILSTANPNAQIKPRQPSPNQASITSPINKRTVSTQSLQTDQMALSDPILELPVITEESGTFASVEIDGLSVTYIYPERVTVAPDDGVLILALDKFSLNAEVFNQATPRHDKTAFLLAKFINSTTEPMLPGSTSLYRDGKFVGRGTVSLVPAGGEQTLAFGPLEGLRLKYTRLNNDTGDQGIISRADTREQAMEFSVENLTNETTVVETLFALPFSEQEDLVVNTRARPAPDETNFEQKREVGRWSLDLAPGEKKTVRLDIKMSWPQGQVLQWRP